MFDELALVVGRDLAMGSFVRQKPIERLDDLSIQIRRIAVALERSTENQINWSDLYEEVMKIEGFDETKLAFAFDHLIQNELRAGSFALKNARLRMQWLESFFNQNI